jgi:hypothetical protein
MEENSWPSFSRASWPAIRRDDIVHAQVSHELAVVIKAMSDGIHGERKARLLPLARACGRLDHVLLVNRRNSLVQSREGTFQDSDRACS